MLNKVALVTGGAQGIGLAISAALLKSGAKVCWEVFLQMTCLIMHRIPYPGAGCTLCNLQVSLLDVRDDLGLAACKQLQMEHTQDRVIFIRCDVTNKDQLVCAIDLYAGEVFEA